MAYKIRCAVPDGKRPVWRPLTRWKDQLMIDWAIDLVCEIPVCICFADRTLWSLCSSRLSALHRSSPTTWLLLNLPLLLPFFAMIWNHFQKNTFFWLTAFVYHGVHDRCRYIGSPDGSHHERRLELWAELLLSLWRRQKYTVHWFGHVMRIDTEWMDRCICTAEPNE